MKVEDIRIAGDTMTIEFIEEDGSGFSVDCTKSVGFEWLQSTFHTVSLKEVRGEDIESYSIDELKARVNMTDIIGAAHQKAEEQAHAVDSYVSKDATIVDTVASWFYTGPGATTWQESAKAFDIAGLDGVRDDSPWRTYGPPFGKHKIFRRLWATVQSKYFGAYECVIKADKVAAMNKLLEMMDKKKGGK